MNHKKASMPELSSVQGKVQQFISSELRIPIRKLALSSRLEADLGVTGDDADEFLELFASTFNVCVDWTKVPEYFHYEGMPCLGWLVRFFDKTYKEQGEVKDVTIETLVKSVQLGRWPP